LFVGIGVASVAIAAPIASYLLIKRRKTNAKTAAVIQESLTFNPETDEEKIMKILKAGGGTVRQSMITDQCRFSKAKTSQLLTSLEQRGVIIRVKKGRDKIVSLNNKK
jgi:uncharacterized membrane protein